MGARVMTPFDPTKALEPTASARRVRAEIDRTIDRADRIAVLWRLGCLAEPPGYGVPHLQQRARAKSKAGRKLMACLGEDEAEIAAAGAFLIALWQSHADENKFQHAVGCGR
jgi:hypothetical protein